MPYFLTLNCECLNQLSTSGQSLILWPWKVGWLCWGLTSQSTIFQSCRDGAIASWVINQYFRGVKCLAQGHWPWKVYGLRKLHGNTCWASCQVSIVKTKLPVPCNAWINLDWRDYNCQRPVFYWLGISIWLVQGATDDLWQNLKTRLVVIFRCTAGKKFESGELLAFLCILGTFLTSRDAESGIPKDPENKLST